MPIDYYISWDPMICMALLALVHISLESSNPARLLDLVWNWMFCNINYDCSNYFNCFNTSLVPTQLTTRLHDRDHWSIIKYRYRGTVYTQNNLFIFDHLHSSRLDWRAWHDDLWVMTFKLSAFDHVYWFYFCYHFTVSVFHLLISSLHYWTILRHLWYKS